MRLRVLALAVGALLAYPSLAAGADRIYWTNATEDAVKFGNLDGSGTATTLFGSEANPVHGIAIDPVLGRIFWANEGANAIRGGAIDGSGTAGSLFSAESDPIGMAVDSASGKIYWADFTSGAIRVADADGSSAPTNLFTGENQPRGVTIDAQNGRIYWTSQGSASIRVGNLNGTGTPATLFSGNPINNLPTGVVVDSGPRRIYWADNLAGTIVMANLDGSGTPTVIYSGEADPYGLALDPGGGKLYWAADGGGIRVGTLEGGTPAADLFPDELGAQYPALLRIPVGTARPALSGGTGVGDQLTCSTGNWADDDPGAFLYRQPVSYSYKWQRNGTEISGAESSTFTPTASGSYTCTVQGSNPAGSAEQTSDAVTIDPDPPTCSNTAVSTAAGTPVEVSLQCSGEGTLAFEVVSPPQHGQVSDLDSAAGKLTYVPNQGFSGADTFTYRASNAAGTSNVGTGQITVQPAGPPPGPGPSVGGQANGFRKAGVKRNRRRGTAIIRVQVPGAGTVHLQGKGVQPAFDATGVGGVLNLNVRPKDFTRSRLTATGRARVRLTLTYAPPGGSVTSLRLKLVLLKASSR